MRDSSVQFGKTRYHTDFSLLLDIVVHYFQIKEPGSLISKNGQNIARLAAAIQVCVLSK
jgi:hypothetical protein